MDNETIYLLQELEEAFKAMTGYSLTMSEKAASFIQEKCGDSNHYDSNGNEYFPVSSRFLRDYWPSMVKSRNKENYEETKGKPRVNTAPSKSKLNLISKCAGYTSWEAFCNITKKRIITENTYFDPKDFKVENMKENDLPIIIGWYPQYFIKLQYLGNYQFKVLSYSYNLSHKYEEGEIKKIYGFEVRYIYEIGEALGLRKKENETEEEYKKRNKEQKYVGGCPLFPQLLIFTKPKNEESLMDENTCFIIRS